VAENLLEVPGVFTDGKAGFNDRRITQKLYLKRKGCLKSFIRLSGHPLRHSREFR
jgi:hypothetical protein